MTDEIVFRNQAKLDHITHFATGIAVFNDGKLLVVKRSQNDDVLGGAWELPGGGVDTGETIEQSAVRELFEETGLIVDKVIGTFEGFDYTTPYKPQVRQVNFIVTVMSGDIQLDPAEHDEYRWITFEDVFNLKTNTVMQDCLSNAFKFKLRQ